MRFFVLITLILSAGSGQEAPQPSLTVILRDSDDRGIAGVQVVVQAAETHELLARALTGADGSARFDRLPSQALRVAVRGALPGGPALRQVGMDAGGVPVQLAAGGARLDLRAEPGGMVIPDPATMIAADTPEARLVAAPAAPGSSRAPGATAVPVAPWALPLALCCASVGLLLAGRRNAR